MPSPFVNQIAKTYGKSSAEAESLWTKAKEIASDTLGIPEDKFTSKEYAYTSGIVKNMLGIKEELNDPEIFLSSKVGVREFIETVVSSSFNIGTIIPPKVLEPIATKKRPEPEEAEDDTIPEGDLPLDLSGIPVKEAEVADVNDKSAKLISDNELLQRMMQDAL